ncbi:MAG TPA: IS1182 family transposase [Clostridia bacterium]|nr:IS1182 family transposase [Clostridia bacterium]
MSYITGSDRKQPNLLPPCIDDYIGAENPVRLIDAFVETLDLAQLGFQLPRQNSQNRGRPAYPPQALLKLYVYGYQHRIRSSRRLEAECGRNLEVMWLTADLRPDHKTIADFRKANAAAFKAVLRQFTRVCKELQLFGGELIAVDGTKMQAQNAVARNWTLTKLQKRESKIQEAVEEYLQALEQADQAEAAPVPHLSVEQLQEKMAQLQAEQQHLREIRQELKETHQTQLSATDPESRSMRSAHGFLVGYNVQAAVDSKHHLLVVSEVTNQGADQGQLAPMAQAVKKELDLPAESTLVADKGYFTNADIKACQELGFQVHMSGSTQSHSERAGYFGPQAFAYDAARNVFRCPAGQELKFRRKTAKEWYNYQNAKACAACQLKARCTAKAHRTVSRWEHAHCLEQMRQQMAAAPEKLPRRKALIEHCWGTLKSLLLGGFLLRGLVKVGAEVSLAHLAYNFKRALRVVGFQRLLQGVCAAAAGAR